MKTKILFITFLTFTLMSCFKEIKTLIFGTNKSQFPELSQKSIYDFDMERLMGGTAKLDLYKGKVLLIVNVASKCGLTPQYKDLEEIYKKYQDSGLMILGFPANNFLRQEPGDNKDIAEFCQINYGVSFDMFSKISVKGDDMHPLYQFLTQKKYNQHSDNEVSWNFQKYLIDKEGNLVQVISPKTKVTDSSVINQIEALLGK